MPIPIHITHRNSFLGRNINKSTTHKHKKTACMENCVKIKTGINLHNARSLKNKTAEIVDHVLSKKINVCIATETWLKEAGILA